MGFLNDPRPLAYRKEPLAYRKKTCRSPLRHVEHDARVEDPLPETELLETDQPVHVGGQRCEVVRPLVRTIRGSLLGALSPPVIAISVSSARIG